MFTHFMRIKKDIKANMERGPISGENIMMIPTVKRCLIIITILTNINNNPDYKA